MHPTPDSRVAPQAALIQLATGTLATGLAVFFACPALGAAGMGSLADGERYAAPASRLRIACIGVAAIALLATAHAVLSPLPMSGWVLIAFGAAGLLAHAAATLAALPARLTWLRGAMLAGTVHGVTFAAGVMLLLRPAGWVCLAASMVIGLTIIGSRFGAPRRAAAS